MKNQAEQQYFEWLISQINIRGTRTFYDLFETLFMIEFDWTVPHDRNRQQDGLDLRTEFFNGKKIPLNKRATILEVLIALSRRLAFTAGGRAEDWAWQLLV